MGRDSWDDDDDDDRPRRRRRRDRYDDDEDDDLGRRRKREAPSGAVTGVGVIGIILGILVLLLGMCLLMGVAFMGEAGRQGAFAMPGFGAGMAVVMVVTILILLWGALAMVAGIGVINRKQWGRILNLIVTGIGAAAGLLSLVGAIVALSAAADAGPGRGPVMMGSMLNFLVAFVLIGYCIQSYIVLLGSRGASEFN
jgi:hypothetical protein